MTGAGDRNADSKDDLRVGYQGEDRVLAFSESSGALLRTEVGQFEGDLLGFSVSGLGDVDSDGKAEFLAGATLRGHGFTGPENGLAIVYDGAQAGSAMYKFFGDFEGDHFGWSVDGIRDINRDGKADILTGGPGGDFASDAGLSQGECRIFSGANGAALFVARGNSAGEFFGDAVSYGGRLAKKSDLQIIVSAPARGTPAAKRALVFTIPNSNPNIQQGGL